MNELEKILARIAEEGGRLERAARIVPVLLNETRAEGEDAEYRFELSFSSETDAVQRWFGTEILGHQPGEVRMDRIKSGNHPFLLLHDQTKQLGVIESAKLENGRGTAVVRFGRSELAQEIRQDVIDGIRTNVSVGYRVHEMVLIRESDEGDAYRVTDWEPYEISIVPVPADINVGIGRSETEPFPKKTSKKERIIMDPEKLKKLARELGLSEDASLDSVLAAKEKRDREDGERKAKVTMDAELARQNAIREFAAAHRERVADVDARAEAAVAARTDAKDFQMEILRLYSEGKVSVKSAKSVGSDERKMFDNFSLRKFLLAALMGERLDGAEAEVQQEGQKEANARGLEVGPGYLPASAIGVIAARAGQNATTNADGKFLIATENIGLIGALKPRLWMTKLGVTMLSGLVNNITLPTVEDEKEAQDRTEVQALDVTDVVFGQRTLSPTRVGAHAEFSLQLLRQSSPQIDGVLANIILSRIARRYNQRGIDFLLALVGTSPIVTNGAPLSHAIMRSFITAIAKDNADEAPGKYLINPDIEGLLATTKVDAGSGLFLFTEKENGEGRILNRESLTTSLVPADLGDADDLSAILYGNFSKLWMGDWGGVDIVRDIYTKAKTGQIVITANSFIGFAAENPKYFAIAKDVDPTAIADDGE
jgi:HK97 family phage major capsid protein